MSIIAMKQALEALENSIDDVRDCLNQNLPLAGYARYDQRIEWYREQITKHEDAITSLRQAIEQAEKEQQRKSLGVCLKCGANECGSRDCPINAQTQREWVGLTDAELAEFSDMKLGAYDLCLEVDAKLRSKNT
jgi:hypothetical protein